MQICFSKSENFTNNIHFIQVQKLLYGEFFWSFNLVPRVPGPIPLPPEGGGGGRGKGPWNEAVEV